MSKLPMLLGFLLVFAAAALGQDNTVTQEENPSGFVWSAGFILDFVNPGKDVRLPAEVRQFTSPTTGGTLTFADRGSSLPRTDIAEIPVMVGYRFWPFKVMAGPDFVRPNLININSKAEDVRTSSIPGGQASVGIRMKDSWKVGMAAQFAVALSQHWDVVFDPAFIPIQYTAEVAVNGRTVNASPVFKETLQKYMAGVEWHDRVAIKPQVGFMTSKSVGTLFAFGIGVGFGKH